MVKSDNMNHIFATIADEILRYGHEKSGTLELNNVIFELTNIENNIPTNYTDFSYGYLCAEELWYANADEKLEFISKFRAPGFKRTSEDGIYSNSAYGHIVFKRHGFNQVEQVIEILKKDKNSRRAVINLNVPNSHRMTCKDEICTFNLAFYINNGKLYCTAMMRSNDYCGCMPYDVAFFTNLQKYIAHRIGVECGSYTHFATSLHIYAKNYDVIRKLSDKSIKYRFDFTKLIVEKDVILKEFNDKELEEKDSYFYSPENNLLYLFKTHKILNEVE